MLLRWCTWEGLGPGVRVRIRARVRVRVRVRVRANLARDVGVLLQDCRDALDGDRVLATLLAVEVVDAPRLPRAGLLGRLLRRT